MLMRLELAAKTVGVAFWGAEVVLMTAWLKLAELILSCVDEA